MQASKMFVQINWWSFLKSRPVLVALLWAIGVEIVFGFWVFWFLRVSTDQAQFYLLSTISQVLAAVLGIGLTAVLVLVQLLSRYVPGMRVPLGRWTIIYLWMYVIGILLPLTSLQSARWDWMVRAGIELAGFQISMGGLSLWWGSLCLALLPAYLLYLRDYISPRGWLDGLERKAKHIDKWPADERNRHYIEYSTAALNALEAKDYSTFLGALSHLCDSLLENKPLPDLVPQEIIHYYPQRVEEAWQIILMQIVHINLEAVESPVAFAFKSNAFRRLGIRAVQPDSQESQFAACQAIALLEKAGHQAIHREYEGPAITTISHLAGLAHEALKNDKMAIVFTRGLQALAPMVCEIIEKWPLEEERDMATRHGVSRIGYLGDEAATAGKGAMASRCIRQLTYLWRFFNGRDEVEHRREAASWLGKIGINAANRGLWRAAKDTTRGMTQHVITETSASLPDNEVIEASIGNLAAFALGVLEFCRSSSTTDDGTVSAVIEALDKVHNEAKGKSVADALRESRGALRRIGRTAANNGHWEGTDKATIWMTQLALGEIASAVPSKEVTIDAAAALRDFGLSTLTHCQSTATNDDKAVCNVVRSFTEIATSAARVASLEETATTALNYIGHITVTGMDKGLRDSPVVAACSIAALKPVFASSPTLWAQYARTVAWVKKQATTFSRSDVIAELP